MKHLTFANRDAMFLAILAAVITYFVLSLSFIRARIENMESAPTESAPTESVPPTETAPTESPSVPLPTETAPTPSSPTEAPPITPPSNLMAPAPGPAPAPSPASSPPVGSPGPSPSRPRRQRERTRESGWSSGPSYWDRDWFDFGPPQPQQTPIIISSPSPVTEPNPLLTAGVLGAILLAVALAR